METDTNRLKRLKTQANRLPLTPGVYIMKNKDGKIIYIGKAKALKNRVTQYFGSGNNHTEKVRRMVAGVENFEYILCDTEYEALMLENSLIKQHQPKYNILLKDDKGYHYIKVTNERWPKIETAKTMLNDGAEYIGPYYSGYVVKQTVDEAPKIFKLPSCNRGFDKRTRPCLNYHIGLCSAPCAGEISHAAYIETVKSAVSYIKKGGVNESDMAELKRKMDVAAENLDFEYAARLRDRIRAIEKSREKQKVISSVYERQDVFAMALAGETACVVVLVFTGGHLSDKKQFFLDGAQDKPSAYPEFLQQYYSNYTDVPPRIALDSDIEDQTLLEEWLTSLHGAKVSIHKPQIGEQKKLVDMCLSNAAEALSVKLERSGREMTALNELADLLGLKTVPRVIESYDISNTAGSENVASMVVFVDGRPQKALYRRFKIKSFIGQDDYRSMEEVLDRRFGEYEKGEDESFRRLPDLILLDGGKGQLSAVRPVMEKHKLNIPLFGMVKDSKHKTRAITAGGDDIQIKANRKAYTLVTNIQDEVHRFAIGYHHTRKRISTLQLDLLTIDGVGDVTAKKLLAAFKTISKIKESSVEDLRKIGMSEKVAQNVYHHYHNNE